MAADTFYTNVICVIDQILSRLQDESLCRLERCLARQNWAITYFTSVLIAHQNLPDFESPFVSGNFEQPVSMLYDVDSDRIHARHL